MKVTKYPVSPRLSPDGATYICDECHRRWKPGESSGCDECRTAIEHGLHLLQQQRPSVGVKIYYVPILFFVLLVILSAILLPKI